MGLFRLQEIPNLHASGADQVAVEAGRSTTLQWTLAGDCARFAEGDDFQVRKGDGQPLDAKILYDPKTAQIAVTLHPMQVPTGGTVQLFARNLFGRAYAIGQPVKLRPAYGVAQIAKLAGLILGFLHTAFFLGLIVAARWSERANQMLLDPVARRIGVWWGFALTYSAALQHWVLRRWFDRRKLEARREPILSMPITNPTTGEEIDSDNLAERLRPGCRIWVQGKPGMGKTTLARAIELCFFSENAGLGAAFRRHGYIPLFVRLREVAIAGSSLGPGDMLWAARLAERPLGRQGLIFDASGASGSNLKLISAIIDHSKFVLLLDGANEVPWSDEIAPAAAARDRPGLLVTSQGPPPPGTAFEHWLLPDTIGDAVEPLLRLFMGDEEGGALFARLKDRPLLGEIRSGYDVRLLQRLAEAGTETLPANRLGLYETMVMYAVGKDRTVAGELAGDAWTIWLSGSRQFQPPAIRKDLVSQLLGQDARILREVGDKLEFMHDQIEAYLAARHIIFDVVNPAGFIADTEPAWGVRIRSEQADLWTFVSEMADDALAQRLFLWTFDDPEGRIELQKALLKRPTLQRKNLLGATSL